MKILRKYIIREFLSPFLYTIILSCIIYLIYEFFFRVHDFMKYQASLLFIMQYLVIQMPLWIKDSLPVSTLVAVVFSLKRFSKDGEITAMKANGINIYNAVLPLILLSLLFSVIGVFLNAYLVPDTYYRRDIHLNVKLKGFSQDGLKRWRNLVVSGIGGENFTVGFYNYDKKVMEDVTIDYISPRYVLTKQIKANAMKWETGKWSLNNGIQRTFSPDGKRILDEEPFSSMELIIPDQPDDFLPGKSDLDEMSQKELYDEISRLKSHGMSYNKELVKYHFRIAYPFASLIVTLLAIPFCLGMSGDKLRQMLGIAYIIFISFVYYVGLNLGRALGTAKTVPPALGAWLGNIVFLCIGIALLMRTRR